MKITNILDIQIGDSVYLVLRDNRHIDGTIAFSELKVAGIDSINELVRTVDFDGNDRGWESLSLFEKV